MMKINFTLLYFTLQGSVVGPHQFSAYTEDIKKTNIASHIVRHNFCADDTDVQTHPQEVHTYLYQCTSLNNVS